MKATLEFNLPEETTEHLQAVQAPAAWALLENIDFRMRSILKHGHEYKSVEALADEIRDDISEVRALIDP